MISNKRFFFILGTAVIIASLGGGLVGGAAVYGFFSIINPPDTLALPDQSSSPSTSDPETFVLSNLDLETNITDSVREISPSVVTVLGVIPGQGNFFSQAANQEVSGSGVIISEDGYILTNNHVIEGTEEVSIVLADGTEVEAQIVGTDEFSDLAVLWTDPEDVPGFAQLGNSDNLSPGETVIAIGSPLGQFKNTVTVGVVSATERMLRINENYQMEGLIQTDAAINQGNSGGPLVNLAGEVIGINTLIIRGGSASTAEGLGFAIPSNMATAVAEQIIKNGYFARPYLGIRWEWITPAISSMYDLPVEWGVYVTNVVPGTPAAQAGLERGDIITQFGDRTLDEENPFINALYDFSPGDQTSLTIQRRGNQETLSITLGEQPDTQ